MTWGPARQGLRGGRHQPSSGGRTSTLVSPSLTRRCLGCLPDSGRASEGHTHIAGQRACDLGSASPKAAPPLTRTSLRTCDVLARRPHTLVLGPVLAESPHLQPPGAPGAAGLRLREAQPTVSARSSSGLTERQSRAGDEPRGTGPKGLDRPGAPAQAPVLEAAARGRTPLAWPVRPGRVPRRESRKTEVRGGHRCWGSAGGESWPEAAAKSPPCPEGPGVGTREGLSLRVGPAGRGGWRETVPGGRGGA